MGVCLQANRYNMEAAKPITIEQKEPLTIEQKVPLTIEQNVPLTIKKNNSNNLIAAKPYCKYYNKENDYFKNLYDINEIEKNKNKTFKRNIIKMKIKIDYNDVNKPTKILYNIKGKVSGLDLNELNESNTKLYINDKNNKYKSYFSPEKEGIYDIQFNLKILMKSCCCLFYCLNNLKILDLSSFNTQNVTNMSYMFCNCKNLKILDLSSFNTQNVTNMCGMFYNCKNLKSLDLSSFNTQNVTNMCGMFYNCKNLESIDLSSFNTQNVTNMSYMFYNCNNLKILDLSSFNTQKVTNMNLMFYNCKIDRIVLNYENNKNKIEKMLNKGATIIYA